MTHRIVPGSQTMLVWGLALILFLGTMSGCGWRLRGSANVELELPSVFLQYQSVSGVLQRELNKAFTNSGVQLVGAEAAGIKLIVHRDSQTRRVLSVGTAGKVNEYELRYDLEFTIRDKEDTLLVKDVISQQRDYTFDDSVVLAKNDEERQLYDFMRRTAVQSLLRRLQSVATTQSTLKQVPEVTSEETPSESAEDVGADAEKPMDKPADAN